MTYPRDALALTHGRTVSHPADMSETQWNVVLRNNALLNAYRVVDAGKTIGKIVERSMHPGSTIESHLPDPCLIY